MLAQHKKYVERRKPATVFRLSEACKKMKDKNECTFGRLCTKLQAQCTLS